MGGTLATATGLTPHDFDVALFMAGAIVILIDGFQRLLRKVWLTGPVVAVAIGLIVGPTGFGWLDPVSWAPASGGLAVMEQAARLSIAITVLHIGITLPRQYVIGRARTLAVLLLVGMLLMWGLSFGVIASLTELSLLHALLLAAVMTPTDPVLAGTIVQGKQARKYIPTRLRHLIYSEAGANDGLAYPLVLLPILLMHRGTAEAWTHWAWRIIGWEVVAAAVVGWVAGCATARLQRLANQRGWSEPQALLPVLLALALATLSGTKLLGMDGIWAVFVAAVAVRWMGSGRVEEEQSRLQNAIERVFQWPVFVLLGAMLPVGAWAGWGWVGVAVAVGVLLLRRLPAIVAISPLLRPLNRWDETLFVGWFGPIGVAAIFYATLVHRHTGETFAWELGTLIVTASVLVHGLTATPVTLAIGRRLGLGQ